jgi:hypothetical protein
LGRTQPNHFGLGRCCQPIKQRASPLFICNVKVEKKTQKKKKKKVEEEREEG